MRLALLVLALLTTGCQTAMSIEDARLVVATFGRAGVIPPPRTINDIMACEESPTGQYFSGRRSIRTPRQRRKGHGKALTVRGACEIFGLDPSFAFTYLVYVLIIVSVGGLGSIAGSFAAAILIGVSDVAGKYYAPELGAFLIYLVMVVVLMWRPAGLFGRR